LANSNFGPLSELYEVTDWCQKRWKK
jgi:hypothetical protein